MSNTAATLINAMVQMLLQSPFYAHVLMGLPRRVEKQAGNTILIRYYCGGFEIVVNPAYWDQLTDQEQLNALRHEVLHLVFQHPFRIRDFEMTWLFHIAADLAVNQWLVEAALPVDFIAKAQFPDLRISDNSSLDDIYDRLVTAWHSPLSYPKSAAALQLLAERGSAALDRHRWWALAGPEIRVKWDTALRLGLATCPPGSLESLPLPLRRELSGWRETPRSAVDWRRALRLACQSSRRTRLSDTAKRPSRRFGTLPGLKIRRKHRIFVAVDTSGSISDSALGSFFSEIHQIWRTGAAVTVIECDSQIGRIFEYEGRRPEKAAGGGGTNFVPPLVYANQHRPDLTIYFTDGEGAAPVLALRYPLLWVITPDSAAKTGALPGRKIRMTL